MLCNIPKILNNIILFINSFQSQKHLKNLLQSTLKISILFLFTLQICSCATMTPVVVYAEYPTNFEKKFHNVSIRKYKDIDKTPDDIIVYTKDLPNEFYYYDNEEQIGFNNSETSEYKVLGLALADYNLALYLRTGYMLYSTQQKFIDEESWRETFCRIQGPLKLFSIGAWAFVPTNYPCIPEYPEDLSQRKKILLDTLKKATAAIEGDILILKNPSHFLVEKESPPYKSFKDSEKKVRQGLYLEGIIVRFKNRTEEQK